MKRIIHPSNFIECTGIVIDRFAETAFHARLPNGKECVAFVEKKQAPLRDLLKPGDRVRLTLCPADMDRARVDALLEAEPRMK